MNIRILIILAAGIFGLNSLPAQVDSTYKKRVLDKMEIQLLSSYYTQDGSNAAVTGGIGTEKLTDVTPTIVVSMPINDDDVLTVDLGISAYTSASSSNNEPTQAFSSSTKLATMKSIMSSFCTRRRDNL